MVIIKSSLDDREFFYVKGYYRWCQKIYEKVKLEEKYSNKCCVLLVERRNPQGAMNDY